MGKLYGSDAENILKKASGVFGDKGFIGTTYLTTPIRKRPDIPVAARDRPQQELKTLQSPQTFRGGIIRDDV
jgi:hypothetical protein